jgi:hypothetical protein
MPHLFTLRILAAPLNPYPMFRIRSAVLHELVVTPSSLNMSQLALDSPNIWQLDVNPAAGLRALDTQLPLSKLRRMSLTVRHCDILEGKFTSPLFASLLEVAITCIRSPTTVSTSLLPAFGRLLTLRGLPGDLTTVQASGSQLYIDSDFFMDLLDIRSYFNASLMVPWFIHHNETALLQLVWRGFSCGTAEPSTGKLNPFNFEIVCVIAEPTGNRVLPSKAAWTSFQCMDSANVPQTMMPFRVCDGVSDCSGNTDELGCMMVLSVVNSTFNESDMYATRCLRQLNLTVTAGVWRSVPASTQEACYYGHGILTSAWTAEGYFGSTTVK